MNDPYQNTEEQVIGLILNGGNARSQALKAVDKAQAGLFAEADKLMAEANSFVSIAHTIQTEFIQNELNASPDKQSVSLLMIHAQDHLMNALTVIDLSEKFISLYKQGREVT